MSFIGGALGGNNSFSAAAPDLMTAVTQGQANAADKQTLAAQQQQQALLAQLQAQNGIGNQSNVFGQQQALADQLQQQTMGGGPNPALSQLNQQTAANTANQAALMAGQRGSGSNAGLLARQAAMQGSANQQQAVGQGATLQAQQQLAAQQQLQQQQASMAGLATNQVSQQQGQTNQNTASQQNYQQNLLNAIAQKNAAEAGATANMNQVNAGVANQNTGFAQGMINGAISGAGAALGGMGGGAAAAPKATPMAGGPAASGMMFAAHGGMAVPMSGPQSSAARMFSKAPVKLSEGGAVPGQAKVAEDSYSNDTVPAMLSPGEIVIPRHIMSSKDPVAAATEFVKSELAKHGKADGGMVTVAPEDSTFGKAQAALKQNLPQAKVNAKEEYDKMHQRLGFANGGSVLDEPDLQPSTPPAAQPNFAMPSPDLMAPATSMVQSPANPAMQFMSDQPSNLPLQAQAPQQQSPMAPQADLMKGIGEQRAGIQGEAKALGQQGKEEAQAAQDSANQMQQLQAHYDEQSNKLNQERSGLQQDIQNGHIDPQHYMNSKSDLGKVSTAIGLILGGIGGAGHSNAALDFLNKNIDRDVEAQKSEMGKKENLLHANMQQFGNLRDATNMTRAMYNDMLATKLKEAAAKAMDPQAKARALQAVGQLDNQSAALQQQVAQRQAVLKGLQTGAANPAQAIQFLVPKEHQAKAYEELSKVQDMNQQQENLRKSFDQLNDMTFRGALSPHERDSAKNAFTGTIQKVSEGRFNAEAADRIADSLLPRMGDSEHTVADKRERLDRFFAPFQKSAVLEGNGLPIPKPKPWLPANKAFQK